MVSKLCLELNSNDTLKGKKQKNLLKESALKPTTASDFFGSTSTSGSNTTGKRKKVVIFSHLIIFFFLLFLNTFLLRKNKARIQPVKMRSKFCPSHQLL